MGIMESLRGWSERHEDADPGDWRVAHDRGWRTETSSDGNVEIEIPMEDDCPGVPHRGHTDRTDTINTTRHVPDNTAAARRVGNIAPDRFIERRPKADRLVYILLRELTEINPDAGRAGHAWYEAHRLELTTQAGSDWIFRIRAKIAEGAPAPVSTVVRPTDHVCGCGCGKAVHAMTPVTTAPSTPVVTSPWSEFRRLAHDVLAAVDATDTGARFAVANAQPNDNDLGFWVIVNRPRPGTTAPMYYLNQYIGGQGPVRVRMTPDAMTTILRRIMDAGPREAMLRFGLEIGSCGDCGRSLTNATSRREGIGPKCKSRHAWLG